MLVQRHKPTPLKLTMKEGNRVRQQSTQSKVSPPPNSSPLQHIKDYSDMPSISLFVNAPEPETRQVKKGDNYIQFHRYCYQKLKNQHKKWSSSQISQMVRLIWKKSKTMQKKRSAMNKAKKTKKIIKSVTGKMAFKKAKTQEGLSAQEILQMWAHLPMQSKQMWGEMGKGRVDNDGKKMNKPVSILMGQTMNPQMNLMNMM